MTRSSGNDNSPMLNVYPDSLGGTLDDLATLLERSETAGAFGSVYVLPSLFQTDLDRGFSVIDYALEATLATPAALERLRAIGLKLKLDLILNHASVQSPQFQSVLKDGRRSKFYDFFIDWDRFWAGYGSPSKEGYLQPDVDALAGMLFRKPGLPVLTVQSKNGERISFWNTFYQQKDYPRIEGDAWARQLDLACADADALATIVNDALDAGVAPADISFGRFEAYAEAVIECLEARCEYLGQMDLNIHSPLVWTFYREVLAQLSSYGASVVRLDAFAYAAKAVGRRNFLNQPETWKLLERVNAIATEYGLTLLPEIHASYAEGCWRQIVERGYLTYDFFLPGLVLDALANQNGTYLAAWASEQVRLGVRAVNMLGCHDGIPLLDMAGLLSEERIRSLIELVVQRGGHVKNLHGQKNVYYQVNAAYYSALGEDEESLLLARAIQIFMPGIPQVWYLDLFAGKNDEEAVRRAGAGGHKEINRTNLTREQIEHGLQTPIVRDQLALIRFRTRSAAFGFDAALESNADGAQLHLVWRKNGCTARLDANLATKRFLVFETDEQGREVFSMTR